MKLYFSTTSPFARKVHMMALLDPIDGFEFEVINPMDQAIRKINPMGKVPVLQDGETVLFDSPLICEYLDQARVKEGYSSLYHRDSPQYFDIQKAHYQANGILDAAVSSVMETRREESLRSAFWLERWQQSMELGIKTFPCQWIGEAAKPSIATLATIAALGYLDFRHQDLDWRSLNPSLAKLMEEAQSCSWVIASDPGRKL